MYTLLEHSFTTAFQKMQRKTYVGADCVKVTDGDKAHLYSALKLGFRDGLWNCEHPNGNSEYGVGPAQIRRARRGKTSSAMSFEHLPGAFLNFASLPSGGPKGPSVRPAALGYSNTNRYKHVRVIV